MHTFYLRLCGSSEKVEKSKQQNPFVFVFNSSLESIVKIVTIYNHKDLKNTITLKNDFLNLAQTLFQTEKFFSIISKASVSSRHGGGVRYDI